MKFIAGPCVIESAELLDTVAERLVEINRSLGVDIIFKASFDKANRTSLESYRGVGMERGLQMLDDVRRKWGLKLLTDIHESYQAAPVGEVVDVIQIPAFLCRQTDLLTAAARTGRTINIKKAQFLSGEDMKYPYEKCIRSGAGEVWLTERGNMYGYNNLVVDFRNIPDMLHISPTVVMEEASSSPSSSTPNSSSRAMERSTMSTESAFRSSANEVSMVMLSGSTLNCSAINAHSFSKIITPCSFVVPLAHILSLL